MRLLLYCIYKEDNIKAEQRFLNSPYFKNMGIWQILYITEDIIKRYHLSRIQFVICVQSLKFAYSEAHHVQIQEFILRQQDKNAKT